MTPRIEPVELRGSLVLLEPLSQRHGAELVEAVGDGDLHTLWYTNVPGPERWGRRSTDD